MLIPAAEEVLRGEPFSTEMIERAARVAQELTEVGNDLRASGEYRRQLVYVGVKRCLSETKAQRKEEIR